jgi:ACS family hexuronate transporter-like MFS transporter
MSPPPQRPGSWKWWVCGLLLLASAINYMDRQTLANASVRISNEFGLSQEQYGNLESAFGLAFAAGSVFFGAVIDSLPLRWSYPCVLLLWSAAGFATGLVHDYKGLLICRTVLGFLEAGHWPCAVKVTQRLLEPKDRSMGNSLLQSGTSIGAITTPLIMQLILTPAIGSWRPAFQIVGAAGVLWVAVWFLLIRRGELDKSSVASDAQAMAASKGPSFLSLLLSRRLLVVFVVIALINTGWQLLRAWLPKFLQQGRGYGESEMLWFNAFFYVATDVGCIGAGALTLWLHGKKGLSVNGARKLGFAICAALSALTLFIPLVPRGPILLLLLLLVGAGALGVFPIYHAFTQDISREHQAKVTGAAGVAGWLLSPAQKYYGRLIDKTGSFDLGFALAGCMPMFAFIFIAALWEPRRKRPEHNSI